MKKFLSALVSLNSSNRSSASFPHKMLSWGGQSKPPQHITKVPPTLY